MMHPKFDPDRISRLIADSLNGSLSTEEREELRCWAEQSPQNQHLLELLGDAESVRRTTTRLGQYDARMGWQRVEHRVRRRRVFRVAAPLVGFAAAIAVAVVAGVFSPVTVLLPAAPVAAVLEDTAAVKLYRPTGEVIVVDSVQRIDLAGAVAESDAQGMTLRPHEQEERSAQKTVFNQVAVPACKQFTVTLSDGTRVVLNASSSLRFPEQFAQNGAREVFLSGEAFFEVQKDARHPFIVHTDAGYVRVTGTEFNVSCYDDDASLVTTLVGGRVSVGGEAAEEVVLKPGMQALKNKTSGAVTTRAVDVTEFTAWTEGLFAFRERPLSEIMTDIARWYGCGVEFENPQRASIRFTGRVSRSSTLEQLADYFSHTGGVRVEVRGDLLVIR